MLPPESAKLMDRRSFLLLSFAGAPGVPVADPYRNQRLRMVKEQIEARGVRNPAVLESMRTVPRERFVPESARPQSYGDHPLPIGFGQTISQPYIVAFMTELLDVRKTHRILEIGTGSGYQAAVLSILANHVYSIELLPALAYTAAQTLADLGYRNVTVREGDGYLGWPDKAPFDRIILTAAPPQLPQLLVDELKPGGKLVAPVGTGDDQSLILVEKSESGKVTTKTVLPVRFVPMRKGL